MADEPQNPVTEDEEVVEQPTEPQAPEPEAEEQPTEQAEPDTEEAEAPAEEPQEEGTTEEPAPPSRREQLRIQQLLAKYGDPRQKQQQPPKQPEALDYRQTLDADDEVVNTLENDRRTYGESQYNEGLKRAEFIDWKTSLKIDAPVVEKKYPILDPNSEEFHPAVADAMNTWYLKMSGFDPDTQTVRSADMSYADFVEANMELVEEIAGQKNAQTVKNVAKQAASTGLRPDGSSAKRLDLTKPPEEMTTEELYAAIGMKPPKQ